MLKKMLFVLIIVLFGFNLIACSKQKNPINLEEKIKIGFVGPFSGPASRFGQFMNNRLELALSELSQEERDNVQVIMGDSQASPKTSVDVVRKLTEANKVNYIIGPMMNASILATENIINDNQIATLTVGLPNQQIANMDDYHFSFLPETGLLKKQLAKYVKQERKINKVAVIYLNDAFGEELRTKFSEYYKELGGEVLVEEPFVKGGADFKTQLAKIKASNPEGIFIGAYAKDLIAILKELNELGLKDLPKFGIHSFESPDVLDEVAELAEGVIFPTFRQGGTEKPTSVDGFVRKHQERFGFYPDLCSAATYDSFNILYSAIKECGYEDRECVREKLSNIKNYEGANGLLTVDGRGVAIFDEARLRIVIDGKFEDL